MNSCISPLKCKSIIHAWDKIPNDVNMCPDFNVFLRINPVSCGKKMNRKNHASLLWNYSAFVIKCVYVLRVSTAAIFNTKRTQGTQWWCRFFLKTFIALRNHTSWNFLYIMDAWFLSSLETTKSLKYFRVALKNSLDLTLIYSQGFLLTKVNKLSSS